MGRKRKLRLTKEDYNPKSYSELRKQFPDYLVDAFVDCVNSNWKDEDKHETYVQAAEKYKKKDSKKHALEFAKLVVQLSRATFDIVDKNKGFIENIEKNRKK